MILSSSSTIILNLISDYVLKEDAKQAILARAIFSTLR